jgi:hypothetical protein
MLSICVPSHRCQLGVLPVGGDEAQDSYSAIPYGATVLDARAHDCLLGLYYLDHSERGKET